MAKQGSLSINSENIFPIIKKWLYSDHDIFIRELVSNGCDAVTKLKKLSVMGEFEEADDEKYKVEVRINPTDKTLTFIDNGIGMTEDEVDEYINQIAFSGAAAFMEQYKDKASDEQIIGHFGLGFYSAFMVADKVTIDTLSYKEGATPVHWECDGGTEFDMEDGDKAERGTTITLYLNDESYEFCNEYRCREVLNKYCSFMPVEIYFVNEEEEAKKAEEAAKKDAEEKVIDVDVKDADAKENNADTVDGDSEVTLEEEEEEEDDRPKIAVIGKPNAGKSSIINKLLGEERVIVSPVAGTTRDAIDTTVKRNGQEYVFIDTAGLRRKSKIKEELERYSIIRTVTAVERCDVAVLIIDATEGITEQDAKIAGIAHERGKGMIIAVNKWDLVEKDNTTMKKFTEKIREKLSYMPYAELIFLSAKTGQRLPKLFEMIDAVIENCALRVQTGVLNEILTEAMAMKQPPSDKGKRLRIYYITQVSVKPPTFVMFINEKKLTHFSYTRYIENQIRTTFGFRGTPIHFIYRERKEK